jgi:putative methionine-R-sulfoxide reductase with GAF domain
VFDNKRRLIAVFDIDSDRKNAFGPDDQRGLERLMGWFARKH